MNEENWIETTKMRKNLKKKKLLKKFLNKDKRSPYRIWRRQQEEWKAETRENEGKERG